MVERHAKDVQNKKVYKLGSLNLSHRYYLLQAPNCQLALLGCCDINGCIVQTDVRTFAVLCQYYIILYHFTTTTPFLAIYLLIVHTCFNSQADAETKPETSIYLISGPIGDNGTFCYTILGTYIAKMVLGSCLDIFFARIRGEYYNV